MQIGKYDDDPAVGVHLERESLQMVCFPCRGTTFAEVRPHEWRCTECNSSHVQVIPKTS